MRLKKLLSCILILAFLLALAGCQSAAAGTLKPIDLVPQGVDFIAGLQINRMINDDDFKDIWENSAMSTSGPQTMDEGLNELFNETGIDLHNFSTGTVFGNIASFNGDNAYLGIVAEGSFNEKTFISNIEEKGNTSLTTSNYKEYRLYSFEEGEPSLTFLSNEIMLVGSTQAVKDIIDVSQGEYPRLSGQLLDFYGGLDGNLIKAASIIPDNARQQLNEVQPSDFPFSLESLADVDLTGMTLDKQNENISLLINSHFTSATSAQNASDMVSGLISMFKGMYQQADVKELLNAVNVSVSNSTVNINFQITVTQINDLIQKYR